MEEEHADAVDCSAAGRTVDELPAALTPAVPETEEEETHAETVETRPMLWTMAEELGARIRRAEWGWSGYVPLSLVSLVAGAARAMSDTRSEVTAGRPPTGWAAPALPSIVGLARWMLCGEWAYRLNHGQALVPEPHRQRHLSRCRAGVQCSLPG